MFFVAVGTNRQPKNLKCGGCTWYQPAETYTYVGCVPDTYVPGISRLPRYVYDTRYLVRRYQYQIRMYLVSAGYPDTYVPGINLQTNVRPVDAHV